jgi:DNA processing protein
MKMHICYYLALSSIKGISNRKIKRFIDIYKTITTITELDNAALMEAGFTEKDIEKIKQMEPRKFEKELNRIKSSNIAIITLEDELYPTELKNIYDPPAILYCFGQLSLLSKPKIAIVGSRKASPKGKEFAHELAKNLSELGIVVVSGFAYGIDISAHLGAIDNGATIAVLGSGLNKIYPEVHKKYLKAFIKGGLIVSEFSLDEPPLAYNFPKRNRIISGLSLGVCVVEASPKSGSLITARLALSQNREIFAVPNAPYMLNSGTNKLIKEGAKLTENYMDIIEEFMNILELPKVIDKIDETNIIHLNSELKQKIYNVIKVNPVSVDEIIEILGIDASRVIAEIVAMELDNIIYEGSDNKYYIRGNNG